MLPRLGTASAGRGVPVRKEGDMDRPERDQRVRGKRITTCATPVKSARDRHSARRRARAHRGSLHTHGPTPCVRQGQEREGLDSRFLSGSQKKPAHPLSARRIWRPVCKKTAQRNLNPNPGWRVQCSVTPHTKMMRERAFADDTGVALNDKEEEAKNLTDFS